MASTKKLIVGLKAIEFESLTLKDKKAYKILYTLARKESYARIPLTSAIDAETTSAFCVDVATILRVGYALYRTQNIVIYTESVADDDGEHTEYILHKKVDGETTVYNDDNIGGKVLKGDTIRPSSAKTASTSASTSATSSKKSESKKDAEKVDAEKQADDAYIDDKVKAITAEIEKILPNYGKFEKSKLALLSIEIEKIIKKQFDC